MAPDVSALLDHPRRRSIACAVLESSMTVGEIASKLGTVDGAIRSVVERLAREELLEASQEPGRRSGVTVTRFRVAAAYTEEVRDRCQQRDDVGVEPDSEWLLVPLEGLVSVGRVLVRHEPSSVSWAIRTRDPQLALIIALRADTPAAEKDWLLLQIRASGTECVRVHVGELLAPDELIDYLRVVDEGGTTSRQLPSG